MLFFSKRTPSSLITMYTTKPLSLFKSNPEAAAEPPPEGRNTSYLVVKSTRDKEDDEKTWLGPTGRVMGLPFPQNRVLRVETGEESAAVVFVPVPDQPLASNRYYIIVASGKDKGLLMACSREEDVTMCCLHRCIPVVEPRPFDPVDVYQQIEIVQHERGSFTARAVAADGFPPSILRYKYWTVYDRVEDRYYESKKIVLGEARGLDATLRSRRLADGVPGAATEAVGKWYCPFFHIKEHGVTRRDQMGRRREMVLPILPLQRTRRNTMGPQRGGVFYEVVLEQRWEPVRGDAVRHDGDSSKLASKKVLIGGSVEARLEPGSSWHGGAYMWFTAATTGQRVGVCTMVWERMVWEETKAGWVDEEKDAGSVADGWVVLVERFVVKRMDGSVVLAFDFVHRQYNES